jgi:hypothetical protein
VTGTRFDDFFALFGLKPMNCAPPLRQDIRFDRFHSYTSNRYIRSLAHDDVDTTTTCPITNIVFREHREDQLMLDFHGCLDSESL